MADRSFIENSGGGTAGPPTLPSRSGGFCRELNAEDLVRPLGDAIASALSHVEEQTDALICRAAREETAPLCRWALERIHENNRVAAETGAYACQDCGQAVLFVTLGQDLHVSGNLSAALNAAVERGYASARKSVADPITRKNTGTNTPAVIHYEFADGSALTVSYLAKGAGSENMSRIDMLTPSKGEDGIVKSVLDCVTRAGANPCPPIIVGLGIGGTMESCALLSKKALLRPTGSPSPREDLRRLEQRILREVNALGIGAQGFGGQVTALAVQAEAAPTHIGMLPVAVNIQCHSVRHCTLTF